MPRLAPLRCAVWGSIAFGITLFWVWLATLILPTTMEALQAAKHAVQSAGTLNGCATLSLLPGECVAFAQEGQ